MFLQGSVLHVTRYIDPCSFIAGVSRSEAFLVELSGDTAYFFHS